MAFDKKITQLPSNSLSILNPDKFEQVSKKRFWEPRKAIAEVDKAVRLFYDSLLPHLCTMQADRGSRLSIAVNKDEVLLTLSAAWEVNKSANAYIERCKAENRSPRDGVKRKDEPGSPDGLIEASGNIMANLQDHWTRAGYGKLPSDDELEAATNDSKAIQEMNNL